MKKRLKSMWFRIKGRHICQHQDCLQQGMQCRLNEYDYDGDYHFTGESYWWYCPEHAQVEGFCWYCGEFWGGCEAFDFNKNGLCPNCKDEVDSELESDFEDEMADLYNEVF